MTGPAESFDARRFREVLGHYPTGVVVITAISESGAPVGMVVGSFTSVSLDPPLVAFLPSRTSNSFAQLRTASSFCVNVLAADQEQVCRQFAAKTGDKFAGVAWRAAPSGAPVLEEAVAWIDCDFDDVHEAGDHFIVLGRVRDLGILNPTPPLLFFQGGYGAFSPGALVAPYEGDLLNHIRLADAAREHMERISAELELECYAQGIVADELVIVAGSGTQRSTVRGHIGRRMPFAPPYGALFVAGRGQEAVDAWLSRRNLPLTDEDRDHYRGMLQRVADRRWSIALRAPEHDEVWDEIDQFSTAPRTPGLERRMGALLERLKGHYEPQELAGDELHDVRLLGAPVYGPDGSVVQVLALFGMPPQAGVEQIAAWRDRLAQAADAVTAAIGGRAPDARRP
ncbi:NADH-FMN oxidoreductase RutF, flavin reductase (DIM6/NTAB) family [Thermomonospora echinospora]|uniref:NADH-FMN oxidoreductase RutF, flavin reductase (DIM6/NTAB) family n=1 Tax=Thermomonospora echinospora TaxID=1992 RepID=A0A1H6EA04_9ACTN|nr:flavin reductase [Thermomonospora echinospora]SEG93756.1 NADH-FMN oxidoreductase RutF, flavin reductase (DIM6/NTAB) family [Thermomonospora echinospora]